MNQKLSLFALAALSCLSALAIAATPTITSVLGTVQTGQTLTIAGTSMVQEDQTNWDAFFKTTHPNASGFEGPSITADGYEIRPGATYNTYDSTVKLMGSKSLKGHSTGASTSNLDYGTTFYQWNVNMGGTGQVYVRTYVRWNTAIWPNQDIKFWWMGGSSSYLFFNLEPQANGSAPTRWGFSWSGAPGGDGWHWYNIPGGAIQNDKWYLFEARFQKQGTGTYIVEGWIDNQQLFSVPGNSGVDPNSSGGWASNVNWWTTPSNFDFTIWNDGLVVSSTRIGPASLVEIANGPNYATATKVYQAPEYLSDTSSQIKVNLTGLGAGPYFLWVTNNRGERSLPFSLTSTSTTLPPPLNLRVQ